MDEFKSCSISSIYGDCCNQFNIPYGDTLRADNNLLQFNYASYPFEEFMDSHHDEQLSSNNKLCNKLEKEKICTNRKNLIIWDWDNTLFPTDVFRTHQHKKDKEFTAKLGVLVSYIEKIFIKMIKIYGSSNIIIVTNASETWINTCLNVDIIQDIFINFQRILKTYNITTISAAKPEIIKKYPKNHHKWKEIVFYKYFAEYFNYMDMNGDEKRINCITSIGDGSSEYKGTHNASKYIKNRILNRIRLKPNPSLNDMIVQLKQIYSMTDQFGINMDDIDIDYTSLISVTCSEMECSNTTC